MAANYPSLKLNRRPPLLSARAKYQPDHLGDSDFAWLGVQRRRQQLNG